MRLSRLLALGIVLVSTAITLSVYGAVPSSITVQGRLTDDAGSPLPAGLKTLTFKIFSDTTGGIEIWPAGAGETQSIASDAAGLWTTRIGALIPLGDSVFGDTPRWLEITVDDGINPVETMPRVRLVTGPYAYRVSTVDGAAGGNITSKVSIGPGHSNAGANAFVAGDANAASGDRSAVTGGTQNSAGGEASFIGGGESNATTGLRSVIGGGYSNSVSGSEATVAGGFQNSANDLGTTIAGGSLNVADGVEATIGGGESNHTAGRLSFIGGGDSNSVTANRATVAGGRANQVSGEFGFIGAGQFNLAEDSYPSIAGGTENHASGGFATVAGGRYNRATGFASSIAGGDSNTAQTSYSTTGGGVNNQARSIYSTIGGGGYNTCDLGATVSGGANNHAAGAYSVIGGGGGPNPSDGNGIDIFMEASVIGGGRTNKMHTSYGVIGGGENNSVTGHASVIAGGSTNTTTGINATVGGGIQNTASGSYSTIPGGGNNTSGGQYSFAAGRRAKANFDGSFVWADHTDADFSATNNDQFLIRANGNVGINTNAPLSPLMVQSADQWNPTVGNGWGDFNVSNGAYGLCVGIALGGGGAGTVHIWPKGNAEQIIFGSPTHGDIMWIKKDGYVGIGEDNPSKVLSLPNIDSPDGRGVAYAWDTYSSRRWKKNIVPITHALSKVRRLQGVEYDSKSNGAHDIGLIAEDVGEVIPEVVTYEDNGVDAQSVDYARLVAVLIEGMKEQETRIEQLESIVKQLQQ